MMGGHRINEPLKVCYKLEKIKCSYMQTCDEVYLK